MLTPIFGLTLLTGFAFMLVWAVRFATKHQLKAAISWFLAIGIVGLLLAGTLSGMTQRRFSSLRPGFDGSYLMMGGKWRDDRGIWPNAASESSVPSPAAR